ncbi:MAG TPA: hypothetical protein PLK12_13740 [Prolixibacteraceae bacterium]|nr:hypothetical protein [Prolixibacteraceae bacterium]
MKKWILFLFVSFVCFSVSDAQPLDASTFGLNGYYTISNWLQVPNTGTIDVSGAPNSLIFYSGDASVQDTTYITIEAPAGILVTINWSYTTVDVGSQWDYPVCLINGVMQPFSSFDVGGPLVQNGIETFTVLRGQTFGFGAYTPDGWGGACTINAVSFEFQTVPVGISVVLGAFGLMGVSLFARRRIKGKRQ